MHPFLVLSGASEATLRQWGNIHKLYRLYIFLRERHHFVLYVPNGKATHWHKVYSFIAVDQQTNKCCFKSFQQQHLPNHAWGSVWLYYGMHPFSDRPQTGQKKGALFYSRANHTHSVWVRCPGMQHSATVCILLLNYTVLLYHTVYNCSELFYLSLWYTLDWSLP